MNCDRANQLHAYHDGELSPSDAASLEAHLAACPACAAELESLRQMSDLFHSTETPRLSQMSRHRLHAHIDAAMERGLVRLAWSLSGVAAAVLLMGSVWLATHKDIQPTPVVAKAAPPWVQTVAYANTNAVSDESPAAQWYLADASNRSDEFRNE